MEIILNYIETMFAGVPATEEVMRLRGEITDNMTDRFSELTAAGKSSNEAIGTVISEFGNIDEVLGEMGIERSGKKAKKEMHTYRLSPLKGHIGTYAARTAGLAVLLITVLGISTDIYWSWNNYRAGINYYFIFIMLIIVLFGIAYSLRQRSLKRPLTRSAGNEALLGSIYGKLEKFLNGGRIFLAVFLLLSSLHLFFGFTNLSFIYIHYERFRYVVPFVAGVCWVLFTAAESVQRDIDSFLERPVQKTTAVREVIRFSVPFLTNAVAYEWLHLIMNDGTDELWDFLLFVFVPAGVSVCAAALCAAYIIDRIREKMNHDRVKDKK